MISATPIPIIIVGYRNPNDVTDCLEALRTAAADPAFDVYVCENGGSSAVEALVSALTAACGPCHPDPSLEFRAGESPRFARVCCLRLRGRDARVFIAEATENLGYAGAINAWLRILLTLPAWPGVRILNPDTQPDACALAELVAWGTARRRHGGQPHRSIRTTRSGALARIAMASTPGVDRGARLPRIGRDRA